MNILINTFLSVFFHFNCTVPNLTLHQEMNLGTKAQEHLITSFKISLWKILTLVIISKKLLKLLKIPLLPSAISFSYLHHKFLFIINTIQFRFNQTQLNLHFINTIFQFNQFLIYF